MLLKLLVSTFSLPVIELHYEQNLSGRAIALVSLSAISWPVMEPHVAKIIDAVNDAKPGSFTRVDVGRFRRPSRTPKGIDLRG